MKKSKNLFFALKKMEKRITSELLPLLQKWFLNGFLPTFRPISSIVYFSAIVFRPKIIYFLHFLTFFLQTGFPSSFQIFFLFSFNVRDDSCTSNSCEDPMQQKMPDQKPQRNE